MEFKPYHKIRQFRDIVRDISHAANFKGLDEDGNAMYVESTKPTLKFKGTVKLHGTNAGICYDPEIGIVPQKRGSLIDGLTGHFNFPVFVDANREYLEDLLKTIHYEMKLTHEQITLYGEWAGQGIQKGIGISELPKAFYVFDCKVYNKETEEHIWVDISNLRVKDSVVSIYNINDFETYEVEVDFNNPKKSINKFTEITEAVEKECPVAKHFNVSGIGEGVVWTAFYKGQKYIFKVKGEKHSATKVKKLVQVDMEVLKSINEFVEYACTPNRMDQAIQETEASSRQDTGSYLKWLANDILSEESKTLQSNGLEWKQVAGEISRKGRIYLFEKLDQL